MTLWLQDTDDATTRDSIYHSSRILTDTSGNAQPFAYDNGQGFSISVSSRNQRTKERYAPYSAPTTTLKSHKRKSYLENEGYQKWRSRKRIDIGKDGQPIWPDDVEESFQNAMAHIPPMGKNQRTQGGKNKGRNELIREWILQETGQVRDRKQISSHIQNLSKAFRGDPQWIAMTKGSGDSSLYPKEKAYYFDSIADEVRLIRTLRHEAKLQEAGSCAWGQVCQNRTNVSKLTFSMWVAASQHMSKALHDYTRTTNQQTSATPRKLDSINDWRLQFPDLEETLKSTRDTLDILLVNSNIWPTTEFPAAGSKLGLVLDLDFRDATGENISTLSTFKSWASNTEIYLEGNLVRSSGLKPCFSEDTGLVNLLFEADWWATQLTDLVQKRKDAELDDRDGALQAAESESSAIFRNLTVMQNVYASPTDFDRHGALHKHMAILLWKFEKATDEATGTTSWVRVEHGFKSVVDAKRQKDGSLNDLPHLAAHDDFEHAMKMEDSEQGFPLFDQENTNPFSPTLYLSATYMTGMTPIQTTTAEQSRMFDFCGGTGFTPRPSITQTKQSFDFPKPDAAIPTNLNTSQYSIIPNSIPVALQLPSNSFSSADSENIFSSQARSDRTTTTASTSPAQRHSALANFDMSTHQMLQTQIQDHAKPGEIFTTLTDPDSRLSVADNMHDLDLDPQHMDSMILSEDYTQPLAAQKSEQPLAFDTPRGTRPSLLSHNSFEGVVHLQQDDNFGAQADFDRLLSEQYSMGFDAIFATNDVFIDHEFRTQEPCRSMSQPVLPSNTFHMQDLTAQVKGTDSG